MWLLIEVQSDDDEIDGRYLVDLSGEINVSLNDLAAFFDVSVSDVQILRVFNVLWPEDEAFGLPTIFVNCDEMCFE